MKKTIALAFLAAAVLAVWWFQPVPTAREQYEKALAEHPFRSLMREKMEEEVAAGEEEGDRPDMAMMQNFLWTMDPALKRPTPEALFDMNGRMARTRDERSGKTEGSAASMTWEERGPNVVGGRTRALLFDPNDATKKKVWAGGVSGGLWFNTDITNVSSSWQKVDDFWDNLSVSCIASDPNNTQVMYVGTGEFEYEVRGGGIWKTVDGGTTWTRLTSAQGFFEIRDIVVRNESGTSVVYAAVHPGFGGDSPAYTGGLYRSSNGGTSWTQVLPLAPGSATYTNLPTDIEIGADNTLWVGAKKHFWVSTASSTLYRSATGLAGSWTAVSTFAGSNFKGQIELATAPADANVVYIVVEQDGNVGGLYKTTNKGTSWSSLAMPVDADTGIPASDFSRGQAWYDLIITVHPTDANNVIVGAVDLFKTTNGGTSWSQLSKWWSGIAASASVVHADQHEIVYRPGFPNEAVFSNDGGVYYSANLNATPSLTTISSRNQNYNVTQFYTAAAHPTQANYMLGGTQDNGTRKFTGAGVNATTEAYGGDGAMCFIDQKDPTYQIVSYVYNDISLSTNGGTSFSTKLIDDANTGNFINVGAYDSNLKILFTARDNTSLYRVKNVTTTRNLDQVAITLGSVASALAVSPYATTQTNLYVGTEAGRVFKVINAQNASPVITEITGTSFPNGTVSCISFGANENQMLVTFSNYGVVSIWETTNGGTSWVSREGNLPNMPVRWIEYHPTNFTQVFVATELGVWSTENISTAAPVWTSTNGGLANVRTNMLQVRKADNTMLAATYGRGFFTALIPTELDQVITFDAVTAKTFGDAPFTVTASASSTLPVTFTSSNTSVATVSGSTVTIVGAGTTTLTANQAGNIQYKAAPAANQVLTVNKASQTITFGALAQRNVNEVSFTLSATSSSGLPVSYASSNVSVATVSGNIVAIVGPGTTNITASQSGNANYLAATSVVQPLVVVSRIIKITGTLAFGDVIVGESEVLNLTIESTGTAPVNVSSVTYPAGYTGTVSVSGATTQVAVKLSPTAPTDYNGNIVVNSDATSGVNTIAATGRGVKITGDLLSNEQTKIFPNPASDKIEIHAVGLDQVSTMKIVDAGGKSFEEPVEHVATNRATVKIAHLSCGTYLLAIPVKGKLVFQKFIKQ